MIKTVSIVAFLFPYITIYPFANWSLFFTSFFFSIFKLFPRSLTLLCMSASECDLGFFFFYLSLNLMTQVPIGNKAMFVHLWFKVYEEKKVLFALEEGALKQRTKTPHVLWFHLWAVNLPWLKSHPATGLYFRGRIIYPFSGF